MRPPRKRPGVPPDGLITDKHQMHQLVNGTADFSKLDPELSGPDFDPTAEEYERARKRVLREGPSVTRIPYNFDEEVWSYASIDRWRRLQHERLRWLLLSNRLEGEALEAAQRLKRQHEQREWRPE